MAKLPLGQAVLLRLLCWIMADVELLLLPWVLWRRWRAERRAIEASSSKKDRAGASPGANSSGG